MVFFGEYTVSFSAPGRIVLPKKLRERIIGNTFVLGRGFGNCLSGYDREDWEQRASSLLSVSLLDQENLATRRMVFASAVYLDIDEQGRFVIPRPLLEYAELSQNIVIIGVGDHFEIWEQKNWTTYLQSQQKS